jgi:parallel beta-helix repeat protein
LVYNNNASGIICSKDCYNLLIEGNEVYNNSGAARGIAFSINTTNSVAKNNYVHDQPRCISFNRESNYNEVYNNTISGCRTGIYLSGTFNNSIHHNNMVNVDNGISFKNFKNQIYNNNILNATNGILFHGGSPINVTNNRINDTNAETKYHGILENVAANNDIQNTDNIMKIKKGSIKATSKN